LSIFKEDSLVQLFCLYNTVLIIAGCFMTWIQAGIFIVTLRGIQLPFGRVVLVLGLIGFLILLLELIQRKKRFIWAYGPVGYTSFLVLGVTFLNHYRNQYISGPGIFISALGALQLTAAYVFFLFQKTPSASS